MGYREVSLKMPGNYSEEELISAIRKFTGISKFSYNIVNKSLDARKKNNIHWLLQIIISSDELKGGEPSVIPEIEIPFRKTKEKIVVIGSGPAGLFAAMVLQKAGFETLLLERGREVSRREAGISRFEREGIFDASANYAFGEGGAGTFSDGKLTSRSKHISKERQFIFNSYIQAGAPAEIAYMAHPHIGSDNLKIIVKNLRKDFEKSGGSMLFETLFQDFESENGRIKTVITDKGAFEVDHVILAIGHSAYDTYRMLMRKGVVFRSKNFAIGSRMEHPQQIINLAQWGKESLPGLKAAEYRLTANPVGQQSVYTFCMCPGGIIVPATAFENTNIVNGMSLYRRDLKFANAACVAAVSPLHIFGEEAHPEKLLDWIETLEREFFNYTDSYRAPYCTINGFINKKIPSQAVETSYSQGIQPAPLWEMLPEKVSNSMREGLKEFNRKIRGFDTGIIMGLESKTSSPVQALRNEYGKCTGFDNLYMAGEGSGYAGGIISSGADGIRIAMNILNY